MKRLVAIAVATGLALAAAPTPAGTTRPSKHTAKVRTFAALLRITETPPDDTDATHAAITVGTCRTIAGGWLCHGALSPVAFSGIDGSTCPFVVIVGLHSSRVKDSQCR